MANEQVVSFLNDFSIEVTPSAAKKIDTTSKNTLLYGIGITASLATLDDKKGDHRFHIVIQGQKFSKSISCILKKGLRTREEEESLITEYVIYLVAEVSGLKLSLIHI